MRKRWFPESGQSILDFRFSIFDLNPIALAELSPKMRSVSLLFDDYGPPSP
jgi:hypothetical protein